MHDYLAKIIAHKCDEVAELQSQATVLSNVTRESKKSFKQALAKSSASIIAEIKRRSPSKNDLALITDPALLAQQYVDGGAAAISVLTDQFGFNGSLKDLRTVSAALSDQACPVLRKDFIIDRLQIPESIVAGADAILLIVAVLQDKTAELFDEAKARGLDVLVEVHDLDELEMAVNLGADIIGINNRNLTTFDVDLNTASTLLSYIPEGIVAVAESGIHTLEAATHYIEQGFDALLIGEALVRSDDPATFIRGCCGKEGAC